MAELLREAVAAGELPEQDVDLLAAGIVGLIAEALVGSLSSLAEERPGGEVVGEIVGLCRRTVGFG